MTYFVSNDSRNSSSSNNNNNHPNQYQSSSVVLDNIDDYLAPSQACINPLFQPPPAPSTQTHSAAGGDASTASLNNTNDQPSDSSSSLPSMVGVIPRQRRRIRRSAAAPPPPPLKPEQRQQQQEEDLDLEETMKILTDSSKNEGITTAVAVDGTTTITPASTKPTKTTKETVKATIADCLACSGCVTTAETVLLDQHHSLKSLKKRLNPSTTTSSSEEEHRVHRAITISPNSMADLCRHWNLLSMDQDQDQQQQQKQQQNLLLQRSLATLFHTVLQCNLIMDGNLPLEWSWIEQAEEFVDHYQQKKIQRWKVNNDNDDGIGHGGQNSDCSDGVVGTTKTTATTSNASMGEPSFLSAFNPPPPSIAIDATRTLYYLPDGTTKTIRHSITTTSTTISGISHQLPPSAPHVLISASCPALVCLVEKSIHTLVPNLSKSLSPMSRMGWELSHHYHPEYCDGEHQNSINTGSNNDSNKSNNNNVNNDTWEHWAIMPCHDKKLEASRKDFERPLLVGHSTGDKKKKDKTTPILKAVDLVITTMELVELLEEWLLSISSGNFTSMKEYLETIPPAPVLSIPKRSSWSMKLVDEALTKHPAVFISSGSVHHASEQQVSSSSLSTRTSDIQPQILVDNSGGHADFIFRYAAEKLFHTHIEHVQWKLVSNRDTLSSSSPSGNHNIITSRPYKKGTSTLKSARLASLQKKQQWYEACLYESSSIGGRSYTQEEPPNEKDESSRLVLKFGIVRGMQTMQRALNDIDPTWDYLEAMACPHGCVNGGGSIPLTTPPLLIGNVAKDPLPPNNDDDDGSTKIHPSPSSSAVQVNTTSKTLGKIKETPTETKVRVDKTTEYLLVPLKTIQDDDDISNTNNNGDDEDTGRQRRRRRRYQTRYHVVPPMHHTMGAAAGVNVKDMQW